MNTNENMTKPFDTTTSTNQLNEQYPFTPQRNERNYSQGYNNGYYKEKESMPVRKGEIYYADLNPVVGSEQGGMRPVLIVQNDIGNKHSPTVIAAAITSQREKAKLPTHIELQAKTCGLARDSVVLLEQIRTIDKRRLRERMGELDGSSMEQVNTALSVSFGLNPMPNHNHNNNN